MIAPVVAERSAQPYVAIRAQVTMRTLPEVLPGLTPRVFAWLGKRGLPPAGAPFWKYNVIDMDGLLEVEVGVPVGEPVEGEDEVVAGVLPAGRYAVARYTGNPANLITVTAALREWADREGLAWDVTDTPEGERWGARLEIYETDPALEPDMNNWTTELAFRLLA
jgi:effector-binding domain-containing protein